MEPRLEPIGKHGSHHRCPAVGAEPQGDPDGLLRPLIPLARDDGKEWKAASLE
jgi:hypothetical protein